MDYKNRIADELLRRKMMSSGAVLIEGPKWCGKTTTAAQQAKSILNMSETGRVDYNISMAKLNPAVLLRGERPRLIDEWQLAPSLWDGVRYEVDQAQSPGQYILTGSAVPADMSNVMHTGTGRFSWLRMRPMTLWESGESTGEVSLKDLFSAPQQIAGVSDYDLEKIAFLTCRGGWPFSIDKSNDVALDIAFNYVQALEQRDISAVDGQERNPSRVHKLLRSLARHQGAQVPFTTIRQDLEANERNDLSEKTIASYINALKKIFVIENTEAWNPNIRSKTAVRSSDTNYFADPSIATAALGLGPSDLINDLETFGLIFETLCIRDLRTYAEPLNGKIYHYRDKSGLECDAVIHLRNGSYGLVEIKLGGDKPVDHAAETLKKLANLIDTTKMKAPSFLLILTAVGPYAYRRADNVYVAPISCLKD